jgi:hypothetical protein
MKNELIIVGFRYTVPEDEEAKLFEIIRMLIERGADINARTDVGGEVQSHQFILISQKYQEIEKRVMRENLSI